MIINKLEPKNSVDHEANSDTIKQIIKDNPDLSYEFVRQILIAQAEVAAGKVEFFEFG